MSSKEQLEKGWKGALAGLGLAIAPGQVQAEPPEYPKVKQEVKSKAKFDPSTLHPELHPIAHLESGFGKFTEHQPSSKGEFHTALGAVGAKPITLHEEYTKGKHLQLLYPNLHEPKDFLKQIKTDPNFYNLMASSHWDRLRKKLGTSAKAAYAWRWGIGAARKADQNQINKDAYVQKYLTISNQKVNKSENLNKAIADIKPGRLVGLNAGAKVWDYNHVLSPEHRAAGYHLRIEEEPHGVSNEPGGYPSSGHQYSAILTHPSGNKATDFIVGSVSGDHDPHTMSIDPGLTEISYGHRGKGLGTKIYEAFFSHGKHIKGAKSVMGGSHSTSASATHQSLSRIHGMDYKPQIKPNADASPPGDFDSKYKPYRYELKSEIKYDHFSKGLEEWSKKTNKIKGGQADDKSPKDFDQEQLKIGTKHELEHTNDPKIAQEIAQDHLQEDKNYYKKLSLIE